jgi:tetratricopeptide (TPR) repeat protein
VKKEQAMKRVIPIVGLLLLVITIGLILWPFGPAMPGVAVPEPPPGQEERALHLELGLIYERSGLLDKAHDEYEKAMGAERDGIATMAGAGLQRVLLRQQNAWLKLQASGRAFLLWIAENGLKLLIIVGVVWLAWWLVGLLPRRAGYQLLPFQDHTGQKIGASLANVLHTTLQTTKLTHLKGERGTFALSEHLNMPSFGVPDGESDGTVEALAAVDSFKVGSIDLPLGQFLSAVQRWTSLREHVLSGNLYHSGPLLWIEVEMRNTRTGTIKRIWESRETLSGETDVAERVMALSQNLAYQILYDLCPRLEANSWRSLQLFTEALREMQHYQTEQTDLTILERAASKLEKAVALDPGYLLARYNLGIVYNNLARYDQAREAFREVKEADSRLKLEATYNLGVAYYHLFQDWAYEEAIEQFQKVLGQLGKRTPDRHHRSLMALTHCGLANVYAQQAGRQRGQAQALQTKVSSHCDQAVALAEEDQEIQAVAHVARGIAFSHTDDSGRAIDEFKAAVRLKPNYPVTYIYLGNSYLKQNNPDAAIRWLQQAIRFNPRYEYAHYRLGEVYRTQGEDDLAIEAYRRAPNIADAHNDLGKILAERQQYNEALAAFRQAIALNSRLAEAYSNLAWYIIEAGWQYETSLRQAVQSARRALQLNQGTKYEWHSRDVLGWSYYHWGRLDEAEREFRASIEKEPTKAQNRYHLALLYRARGKDDQARQALIALFNETREKGLWRDKAEELMRELEAQAT